MIRYTPYTETDQNNTVKTPFQIYKEAVARCDESKKNTLQGIEATILGYYNEFDSHLLPQSIHSILSHGIANPEAAMLRSLYSSKAAVIKRIKNYFNNEFPNRIYRNACPYCGLPGAGTTEHILPKEIYPEYAINTLNLLPCCNICNSGKGQRVKDAMGNAEFINFYYHDIESEEFLKADITFDSNGKPQFAFCLEFKPGMDSVLMRVIGNHYDNLHLLSRYISLADSKYVECEQTILTLASGRTDIIEILSYFKEMIEQSFGRNHYYSAMLRSMVESIDYHNYILGII